MKTRFIVDVTTGVISRQTEGVAVPDAQVGVLYARDYMLCEVQFMAGNTEVTADVLSGTRQVMLGLRQYPSDGALLVQSSGYALSAGVGTCIFDLNTGEVVALVGSLPTAARKTSVYFEVQVNDPDGTHPITLAQQQFSLFCEVNMQGDVPPAAAAASADAAAASASLAQDWATKTTGQVAATDFSAKEFASGSQAATGGSSKNWAQQTGADVTGAAANSRSAKSWAQDNLAGATMGGSAKDWAQSATSPDGTTNKSAKSYASDAAGSATAAAGSATSAATSATNSATSASNSAASASLANTYANNAGASAVSAANSVASQFLGVIAGNSVPATAVGAGKYYIISSAGTSQSIAWSFGDWAIYNGTNGSWSRLPAGSVDITALSSRTNNKALQQHLTFDGDGTSNFPQIINASPVSTGDVTVITWFRLFAQNNSIDQSIISGNLGFTFGVQYNGRRLMAWKAGTGYNANKSNTDLQTGIWYCVAYKRTGGVGTYYLNGLPDGTTTDTFDYSAASNLIGSSGYKGPTGVGPIFMYNRALADAEIYQVAQQGKPHGYDYQTPGLVGINQNASGYCLTYGASDANVLGAVGGGDTATVVAGQRTGGAGGYFARLTSIAAGAAYNTLQGAAWTLNNKRGSVVMVRFWAKASTPLAANVYLRNPAAGGGMDTSDVISIGTIGTTWQQFTALVSTTPPPNVQQVYIIVNHGAAGETVDIDDLEIIPLGLTLAPLLDVPGNGFIWCDGTGNGSHIVLPTSSVSWGIPSTAPNRVRGSTNTSGNQALLGLTTIPSGANFLRIRARSRTGTPTVKLGTSSGGGDILAAVALSTTWQNLTIAYTAITAGNVNLWVNSTTTDVVDWDISWEPVST